MLHSADPGDRTERLKLADAIAKKHGGTITEWYKKLGEFGANLPNGKGINSIHINLDIGSPIGITGSVGFAWASDGAGIFYSGGCFHGVDLSLSIAASYSHPVGSSGLSISDFKGLGVSHNFGLGPLTYSFGANTFGTGNFGQNMNSTYNTFTLGGVLYSPIPFSYNRSIATTNFLKLWK